MIFQTLYRAVNILRLEKNAYKEIRKDKSSIYGSGIVMFFAGSVNVYLFKIFILPTLPNEISLIPIFLIWVFFNWYVFSNIMLIIVKAVGGTENLKDKKTALSLVGFSNTAEIFKILIILLPNFIVMISWGVLMLVIASQVVGVKQIYNLDKISTAVGVVIASYIAQFFIIGLLVFFLIKLAY
jgi:hypothetical protein|tara:strand:- start:92 stop:640 length:549 start_codon:yes stop_codon:yes gene_type:complete